MESNWAAENLQTIRTLMERSAIYRRALGPILIYVGLIGLLGAFAGWWFRIEPTRVFAAYWMAISLIALVGAFFLVRRQSLKDGENFWSPPTRRVVQALVPPLLIGMFAGVWFVYVGNGDAKAFGHELVQFQLVIVWVLLYGCALHSAGFFMQRGIRLFGWMFVLMGGLLLVGNANPTLALGRYPRHFMMGILFGATHLAYGIYLYFTEPRKNEA